MFGGTGIRRENQIAAIKEDIAYAERMAQSYADEAAYKKANKRESAYAESLVEYWVERTTALRGELEDWL